jgi:chemotaxis protein methyltransferase CheR
MTLNRDKKDLKMQENFPQPLTTVTMTRNDFDYFSTLIQDRCGIKMPATKKTMLESRLRKRLRHLGLNSFREYLNYVESPTGKSDELVSMINVVTANKTDFFREPAHFEYLYSHAMPTLIEESGAGKERELRVWSAGCSSGEEPYTLAMVLSDYSLNEENLSFRILGTDISTQVLEKARRAIYAEDKVDPVPAMTKKRYLLRSRDRGRAKVRIVPELRRTVEYGRLNFLDPEYRINEEFDIIFCRNVLIYFERENQRTILLKLLEQLAPGGYLFTGHSETLHSLNLPVKLMAPSVYRKRT